jgi:hypothetical protein
MPTETVAAVIGILAVFTFFGGLLLFTDLTWDRARIRR